jgi:hypothetical protein
MSSTLPSVVFDTIITKRASHGGVRIFLETSNVSLAIIGSLGGTSVGAEAFAQIGLKEMGFGDSDPTAITHFV